jgi:pimeloyl-ACP methyl ester carboxylesterase
LKEKAVMRSLAPRWLLSFLLVALVALPLTACVEDESPPGTGSLGKEDDPCKRGSDCLSTLVCASNGTCQRAGESGTKGEGEGCANNDECVIELVCSAQSVCAKPGTGAEGADCIGNETCQKGLLCSATRKCAQPGTPGTKIAGDTCAGEGECALGLLCLLGKCQALTFWSGATCAPDDGALRPYFEIPRGGKALGDFYRLPFPNDIRLTAEGTVDVMQHPDPGVVLPEPYTDVVKSYYEQIKKDVKGFGVNTAVYFRFSKQIDFATLTLQGTDPTVQFIDITKTSPGYAKGVGLLLGASTGRGKYICENWMNVRPTVGQPLRAKTTYAVLLRSGIKAEDGTPATADADLAVVLGDTQPTDGDERKGWLAYAPLREYVKDQSIDAKTIIGAAVFTTMDPRERMAKFGPVVNMQPEPTLNQLTLCDGVKTSPCDDGKDTVRACPTGGPDGRFWELHGQYKTPVFQQGTPPYKTPKDGGDIVYDGSGVPVVQREEDTCVAMSVPRSGQMPPNGWPVVIFAPGTGGSFRSFINNGTAAALAEVKDKAGDTLASFAVVSIDPSMHGPRRGSDDDPDQLFFNLLNPKSARDNVYQGAIDKQRLLRLIKTIDLDTATSPSGEPIKFDLTKIYYFGHSQGTIEGLPFVAFAQDIKGTVMSGAGGYLIGSLLEKKKPFDIAALTQLALAEPQKVTSTHPLLNLLQLYFEEVDSLNYGRAIAAVPPMGLPPKHYFLSLGAKDSFTPPGTIEALTRVSGLPQLQRCGDGVCTGSEDCNSCAADCPAADCSKVDNKFTPVTGPVSGNISKAQGDNITAAMVRYGGDGSFDDHFVLFQLPEGREQSTRFLGTAAKDGVPTIE